MILTKKLFRKELNETKVLFRSIPGLVLALFILSTVLMNILASVALVNDSWIALDAGIIVSFIGFILSDMIVKRFGAKAAIKVTILSLLVNLAVCGLFAIIAMIAASSGAYFALSDYATQTQWWIIGASATAFLISGVIDSLVHAGIKKMFKKKADGIAAHIAGAWVSTFVGQVIDNMIFGLLFTFPASLIGLWGMTPMSLIALFTFAVAGGMVELLSQAIFTPFGYAIAEKWRKDEVGNEYLKLISNNTPSTTDKVG